MTDNIGELKKDYRDIKAPSHLATRIRAEVADQPLRTHSWIPAGATVMAILLVAWIVPYVGEQPPKPSAVPNKPSLAALAALAPDKPTGTSPSLSKVRSVKVPKMPAKPRLKPKNPQSNYDFEIDLMEENDHAHI